MLAATSIALHVADYRDSIADASSQGNASALRIDPVLSKLFPTSAPAEDRALKQGKAFRFEIANGDGVTGLARKVGDTLARHGLPKPQLTNLKPYQQRLTVIQYRDGFHDEAVRLSSKLLKPPVLVNNNALCKNSDVRLVLGKDVVSQMALFGQDGEAVRLAYRDRDAERMSESAVR